MAINPEIRDQAYQFFVEESLELLQTIELGILTLRQGRDTAQVHALMRAAHSLKGGAASVGLEAIQAIAHRLETIFKALYSDSLEVDSAIESQLLQAFDCLRLPLMQQLNQGQFDPEQALATANPILSQIEIAFQGAIAETENYIPGSADLGFNMTASIFEVDVKQGLDHLTTVLKSPEQYEVVGELYAQLEVFTGFAELLGLPGFASIAQTALQALRVNPDRVLEIAELALADFWAGRSAVLAGDTSQGGKPSEALIALAQPLENTALPQPEIATTTEFITTEFATTELTATELTENSATTADIAALLEQFDDREAALQALSELGLLQNTENYPISSDKSSDDLTTQLEQESLDKLDELDKLELLNDLNLTENQTNISTNFLDEAIANHSLTQLTSLLGDFKPLDLVRNEQSKDLIKSLELTAEVENELDIAEFVTDTEIFSQSTGQSADQSVAQPIIQPTVENSETSSSASKEQPQATAVVSTIRVDVDRLTRMNNLLGELTINRNGLVLQNDQLRAAIRDLSTRFARFQTILEQLRQVSDQMLIMPQKQANLPLTISASEPSSKYQKNGLLPQIPSFDTLEMDSYTTLYAHTQTLLEESMQLAESVEDIALFNRQSEQMLGQHRKMLSQMQDEVMGARMIPLERILSRFPRILRDLSTAYHKPAHLTLQGTYLLVDRAVLEKLFDPLLHLLRNAFDHGIEPVEERRAQQKPDAGSIEICASYQGRQVVIDVRDDGRGLDLERIRRRAIDLGWLTSEEAATASETQLYEYIFKPGFSTAETVSELSGRGVGLDVVNEQLRSLKGRVSIHSVPGQGATFTLTLPLTLTIVNLLICLVGSTPIALRSDGIIETLIPKPEQIKLVGHQRLLQWKEQDIPAYRLTDLLTYTCLVPELPPSRILTVVPSPTDWETPMLILKRNQQTFALQVDRLVTEQEMVVKPFGSAIAPPGYAYGCTVLGDGSLIPVMDGLAFIDMLVQRETASAPTLNEVEALTAAMQTNGATEQNQPRIVVDRTSTVLVVDDAFTSRRLLTLSLERAGYRVLEARDGQEALEQLQQNSTIRLVICDIEMPNMNGFEFLTQRRQDARFSQIPTVMLTSRSNDKHRWLAMQLGATDYFTKPYLEQEFLGAIGTLIG